MRHLITEDVNNGEIVNNLFNEWLKVKTPSQHKKVMSKIASARFGTYGTFTVLDVLSNFEVKNHPVKNDFLAETKKAIEAR